MTHESGNVGCQIVEAQRRGILQGNGFLAVRNPRHGDASPLAVMGCTAVALLLQLPEAEAVAKCGAIGHEFRRGAPWGAHRYWKEVLSIIKRPQKSAGESEI